MTPAELRSIMKQKDWTQDDLARQLPLKSTRTIRYWLSGERKIRTLVAERIRSIAIGSRSKKDENGLFA